MEFEVQKRLYQWEEDDKRILEICLNQFRPKELDDDRLMRAYSIEGTFKTNSLIKAATKLLKRKRGSELMA